MRYSENFQGLFSCQTQVRYRSRTVNNLRINVDDISGARFNLLLINRETHAASKNEAQLKFFMPMKRHVSKHF